MTSRQTTLAAINCPVRVQVSNRWTVIEEVTAADGSVRIEFGGASLVCLGETPRLDKRDWKKLRDELLSVDNERKAARFLEHAGYHLVSKGVINVSGWNPAQISPAIYAEVLQYHDGVEMLMTTRNLAGFLERLRIFRQRRPETNSDNRPRPASLMSPNGLERRVKDIGAPVAERFLLGTGDALALIASVSWGATGEPEFRAFCGHALEAIVFTTHLERSFQTRWIRCARCNKLIPIGPWKNQKYCPGGGSCGTYARVSKHREKAKRAAER
jgi:hypothetical protein